MKLFVRKKSHHDIVEPHLGRQAASTTSSAPVIAPLELPAEISTPLYERFARSRQTSNAGDVPSTEPETPLSLFDGSSMGTKAGFRALMQAHSLDDAPPSSYFGLSTRATFDSNQAPSTTIPIPHASSNGARPSNFFPETRPEESHRAVSSSGNPHLNSIVPSRSVPESTKDIRRTGLHKSPSSIQQSTALNRGLSRPENSGSVPLHTKDNSTAIEPESHLRLPAHRLPTPPDVISSTQPLPNSSTHHAKMSKPRNISSRPPVSMNGRTAHPVVDTSSKHSETGSRRSDSQSRLDEATAANVAFPATSSQSPASVLPSTRQKTFSLFARPTPESQPRLQQDAHPSNGASPSPSHNPSSSSTRPSGSGKFSFFASASRSEVELSASASSLERPLPRTPSTSITKAALPSTSTSTSKSSAFDSFLSKSSSKAPAAHEKPGTRLRTVSASQKPPSQVISPSHRSNRGDIPPVSGAPILNRRRNSIQSTDHNFLPSRALGNRAPSPNPSAQWALEHKPPRVGAKQQLPTPASSAGSLYSPPLAMHTSRPQTSPSTSSHPPVASSATLAQNSILARDNSLSSQATTTWPSGASSRTSMTSFESSNDQHSSITHKFASSSSRLISTSHKTGASRPNPLPTTLEASPHPNLHPHPPAPPTFPPPPVPQETETRLSALMLEDDDDPFARPPVIREPKPESPSPRARNPGLAPAPGPSRSRSPSPMPSPAPSIATLKSSGEQIVRDRDKSRDVLRSRHPNDSTPYKQSRHRERRDEHPVSEPSSILADEPAEVGVPEDEPTYYPLRGHLQHPDLVSSLISYLSFRDVYSLWNISAAIRADLERTSDLREAILARFLAPIGYRRWLFEERKEPFIFSFSDLNAYLRGVSLPTHRYAEIAESHLSVLRDDPRMTESLTIARMMAASTRAYTKLVIRMRAQAEVERLHFEDQFRALPFKTELMDPIPPQPVLHKYSHGSEFGHGASHGSRPPVTQPSPSRAPSRTRHNRGTSIAPSIAPSSVTGATLGYNSSGYRFRSPLYKIGHAPLLRVFVPSPEGQWLSDENVIKCEEELKLAEVVPYLKVGDVVWDVAVGDESNLGRMIWDGSYLIDLDYSYSLTGEIPQYIDSLCFPPSYWHKIIRVAGNPICYVDIRPYAKEIAANIGLIQSRVQTETPQGHHHTVIRWIHRSSFQLRGESPLLPTRSGSSSGGRTQLIDMAWEGTVYIEAEGTNEGLEDLQARCGNGVQLTVDKPGAAQVSPPSPTDRFAYKKGGGEFGGKSVFRMMRGNSRPGELWLRCVGEKEKILM